MFRISNNLIGCLNFLTLLVSIPIFVSGIWLATRGGSDCDKVMQGRAIALGAFLMIISLAGFIGACFRVTWLMWFYLVVMFLLILLYICFIAFDFAVTAKGGNGGRAVEGRGFREYYLTDYSQWFRDWAQNKNNWRPTRSCLVDKKVCKSMQQSMETYTQFFKSQLSPIESGCCKPPLECGLVYQKPTVWTAPQDGLNSTNPDCKTGKTTTPPSASTAALARPRTSRPPRSSGGILRLSTPFSSPSSSSFTPSDAAPSGTIRRTTSYPN